MPLDSRIDTKAIVREYQGERTNPVFQYITRKYYCSEQGTVGPISSNLAALSFQIENEEWQDLVMKSVRLHIPIKITPQCGGAAISLKLADRFPAANCALATNPWKCFSNCTMVCNDKVFRTQPNLYQQLLDTCYDTRDELGYGDSHSLKPLAITDFKKFTESQGTYVVQQSGSADEYIQIMDAVSNHSDNASNLVTANGGFLNRVRHMQTEVANQSFCETELVNFIHCGPFMNQVRRNLAGTPKYNDAIPFVKSLKLDFTFDRRQSTFDQDREFNNTGTARPFWPDRSLAMDWLEFATLCNINEPGQIGLPNDNWITSCKFEITSRPYLSVQYVKMGAVLRDQYKLRAIDYIQEKTAPFSFAFPQILENTKLSAPAVQQRISSRLLEMPSKIYLYCELSRDYKKSFFMGGCMRTQRIKNLKLRINNKTNVLFDPTQLELYDHFKRCTRNSWEIGTWEKSPIIVLDPQACGLQEFLAQDSKFLDFEWRFDVEPTAMFCNEISQLASGTSMLTMGYKPQRTQNFAKLELDVGIFKPGVSAVGPTTVDVTKYVPYAPLPGAAGGFGDIQYCAPGAHHFVSRHASQIWLQIKLPSLASYGQGVQDYANCLTEQSGPSFWEKQLLGRYMKLEDAIGRHNREVMEIKRIVSEKTVLKGFVWCVMDTSKDPPELVKQTVQWGDHNQYTMNDVGGWWIPESWPMSFYPEDLRTKLGDLQHEPKRIYSYVEDYDWSTKTWAAGRIPPILRAHIQRYRWDQNQFQRNKYGWVRKSTQLFNENLGDPAQAQCQQTPGPRGYPMFMPSYAGATFLGVYLEGENDGTGYDPQHYTQSDGSFKTTVTNGAGMGGIKVMGIDHTVNPDYRWVCLRYDAATVLMNNSSKFHEGSFNPAHQTGNVNNRWQTGMTEEQLKYVPGFHVSSGTGYEQHLVQVAVERGVLSSAVPDENEFFDYSDGGVVGARSGEPFFFEKRDANTQQNAQALQFESKVLYEFGQKNYLINRAGQITPHLPGIEKLENKSKPVYGWQKDTRIPETSDNKPKKMRRNDYHSQG